VKDFVSRNFGFLVAITVTLLVITGGVVLFTKDSTQKETRISDELLTPNSSYVTSGFKDGKYLPYSESAAVTLVEFGDFECPACAAYHPVVQDLLTEYPGKINFVLRHFPLPQHKNANLTGYAAEAAGLQGKFWEMYTILYENQKEWAGVGNAKEIILDYAKDLELDIAKFENDLDLDEIKQKVSKDASDGNLIGVNATPSFFVNGVKINNPRSFADFKNILEQAMETGPQAVEAEQAYHVHFDIKTYINGAAVNFSQAKYQATAENELDPGIHFHDGDGKAVHIHQKGMTLKKLFDSFKLTFPANSASKNLKVYVNGELNSEGLNYEPLDLDRILVSFGPVSDPLIQDQLLSVSDVACIYSESCPERGSAPQEGCVGGLGSECK
jgi:protein-disulfide isomerase